jgi:hypothetical protein
MHFMYINFMLQRVITVITTISVLLFRMDVVLLVSMGVAVVT